MKITFWGVRGSIPSPGPATVRYGGNTSCVALESGDTMCIFDCGTGIRELGIEMVSRKKPVKCHILISHTHWDHITGFPFFTPLYIPGSEVHVYGPMHHEKTLEQIVTHQMEYSYFPVSTYQLAASLHFHDLKEETFEIDGLTVTTCFLNHPVFMLGYRVTGEGKTVVYTGDNEPYYDFIYTETGDTDVTQARDDVQKLVEDCNNRVVKFVKDADLLIADAQYTPEEYETHRGWGHSTVIDALDLAEKAHVGQLALFHHEPTRNDDGMDVVERRVKAEAKKRNLNGMKVFAAKEKMTVDL